jgi:hypothetical protein
MTKIELLIALSDERKQIVESIARLKNMRGMTPEQSDHPAKAKCSGIEFKTSYGAHMAWGSYQDNGALNMMLVEVSLKYLEERLGQVDSVLGDAEEALTNA